ncbi:hypothetical protein GEV33_000509 [Tenebrio molitor]|uniref:Uncharacterized protein n=1 Tax=Tenebrio molitor TaxID=7067 RepID=A0A8J6HXZ0_TENMO|nr:hypothetical protein GEV33_000509 [Tenebrio molitor]
MVYIEKADPVVLVDVTVRDAVNLLALSLFCFSVSADGLVGLLRGTRGLAGAVVGRGLGGVDVFEVVLVTPLEAVLLTKVLGLGLGAAVVVVVLVVVVLEDAIAGLGAVGFVGLALGAVAGFGADGLGLSNDFLAVKLALTGALTSPFAKGFFSKLVLVVVVQHRLPLPWWWWFWRKLEVSPWRLQLLLSSLSWETPQVSQETRQSSVRVSWHPLEPSP